MKGFDRRTEKKKERIRRAALELFRAHGFKKVGVRDIARRADVSQVTIYKYFGSKDELVRDTVTIQLLDAAERYRAVVHSDCPYQEKIEVIFLDKTGMAREFNGEFVREIFSVDPDIRQVVQNLAAQAQQFLIDFFEEGKTLGHISPDLSRDTFLAYMEILRSGLTAASAYWTDPEQNVKLMRELRALMFYGLAGKSEPQERELR
ncbi:MAG: TetR/AcrR family transcriptional regulator [Dehalococcoidia bacterium]|nr:TetR/AcrR family transcriptional regulator [Dehalococcoidia bacterium]